MNPLEYMQIVKIMTLDSITKNDEAIVKITENLTTAQEYGAILADYSKNCDEVIAILTEQKS